MNQVRIWGDPFGDDGAAGALRGFLRLALGSGLRCALSLTAVQPRPPQTGEREIALTDGVRALGVGTRLPPAELDLLLRAAAEAVAATAPIVVFAACDPADAARLAGLEWSRAAAVVTARTTMTAADLLERVRAELRWAGTEDPEHACTERDLAPWLALPSPPADGPVVHIGSADPAGGTLAAVEAFARLAAPAQRRLRVVLQDDDLGFGERLLAAAAAAGAAPGSIEIVRQAFAPHHLLDAAAVLLPWQQLRWPRLLVHALASGRPVCVSRFAATAAIVGRAGICQPIGGRLVPAESGLPARFLPHPSSIATALRRALASAADAAAMGRRARCHVLEELTAGRSAAPPVRMASVRQPRPSIVLEAPLFETSSSALLSIETARALFRRGNVDLQLVPTVPLRGDLSRLRAQAPELEPLLARGPGTVDLWLSAGWPVRSARPPCRVFALRLDWEYGALPLELTPIATQEADLVVVHSVHVYRTMTAAGRAMPSIKVVPHGVDAALHENVTPSAEVVAFKQQRPAVLFCGGLVWRKGFDVFLRAALAAREAGEDFCIVVKSVGHDQHYGRFHLAELVRRFRATAGTPPLLVLEREMTRAELAQVYAACDVLVHPYRGEGFGLPVLEARACGLPVLITARGACADFADGPGVAKIPCARRALDLPDAHVAEPWIHEPDAVAAGSLLAGILRDLPRQRAAARAFAPTVRAGFTWDAAAAALETLAIAAMAQRRIALPTALAERIVTLPTPASTPAGEPRPLLVPAR